MDVSFVRYSGIFFKRMREELQQIDQSTRKLMTTSKALYPGDDIDWLYVSKNK